MVQAADTLLLSSLLIFFLLPSLRLSIASTLFSSFFFVHDHFYLSFKLTFVLFQLLLSSLSAAAAADQWWR